MQYGDFFLWLKKKPEVTLDFRSVYATVLENWFTVPSQAILGGIYERLGFLG